MRRVSELQGLTRLLQEFVLVSKLLTGYIMSTIVIEDQINLPMSFERMKPIKIQAQQPLGHEPPKLQMLLFC